MSRLKRFMLTVSGTVIAAMYVPALSADLRCGTELIAEGELASTLVAHCGQPDAVSRNIAGDRLWLYEGAAAELQRTVTIRKGKVQRIRDGNAVNEGVSGLPSSGQPSGEPRERKANF